MPKDIREWLSWLIKIRAVVITTLLGVFLGVSSIVPTLGPIDDLIAVIGVVCALSALHYLLLLYFRHYVLQAYFQIACDLGMIFFINSFMGGPESSFSFLYLLSIVMASILLYKTGAFLTAGFSSLLLGIHSSLAFFNAVARGDVAVAMGEIKSALFINVFAFFAVAYLSSTLSENLRKTGRELRDKQGELASLQAFNENIINSMRGGLCTTNLEGIVTLFNRSAGEITGFRQEKVLGMPVANLFNFDEPIPGNPAALTPLRFEKTLRNAEGKKIHLGFTISPLLAEYDRHLGYVYSFQDLTEIKDLEYRVRQKDRLAAIGQMAAVIAHEIRNPLTAIAGAFKLLQPEFSRDEEPQKLLENISLEIKRLYRIVTDFLTYSRPLKFVPRRLDLNRLTAGTLQLVRVGGDALPQHSIQYTRDPDCPLECEVDPDLFKQMLLNLLSNALKAMPEGGTVTLELSEGEDGMARILVRDTGIGLSGEEQARLFEPFQSGFQAGTGLGLSIVAQIVQAHQGTIRVESERGKGAVFEVRLPRKIKEIPVHLKWAAHSGRSV